LIGLISTAPGLPGYTAPAAELRPDDTVEQGVAMLAEAVEPRHERAAPDKQVIVDVVSDFLSRYADLQGASRVIVSNASVIRLSFRMHDKFGDWRILDVVAEGVSYLKLYRSEFRQEIAEYGLDQAIERFAQKAAP
jgi:ABC-type transporter MlaC component